MPTQLNPQSKISNEYKETSERIERIKEVIKCVLNKIGKFKVLDEELVPQGLKPIARSIAWLVDQVVIQNLIVVDFDNIFVKFEDLILFNVAWVPEVYYNRANHNLQSRANGMQTPRSNREFVELLKQKM